MNSSHPEGSLPRGPAEPHKINRRCSCACYLAPGLLVLPYKSLQHSPRPDRAKLTNRAICRLKSKRGFRREISSSTQQFDNAISLREVIERGAKHVDAKDDTGVEPSRRYSRAGSSSQESLVEALLEGIGEGFFALDVAFYCLQSRGGGNIRHPRAAVVGRTIWEVSPRIIGTEFERRYRRVMAERTARSSRAFSALRPDRYHEVRTFPFGTGSGWRVATSLIGERQPGAARPGIGAGSSSANRRHRRVGSRS